MVVFLPVVPVSYNLSFSILRYIVYSIKIPYFRTRFNLNHLLLCQSKYEFLEKYQDALSISLNNRFAHKQERLCICWAIGKNECQLDQVAMGERGPYGALSPSSVIWRINARSGFKHSNIL